MVAKGLIENNSSIKDAIATEAYSIEDEPFSGDLFPEMDNNNLSIPGIGLVPSEVLDDTHFDVRGRLGRLVVAMRDTNKTLVLVENKATG